MNLRRHRSSDARGSRDHSGEPWRLLIGLTIGVVGGLALWVSLPYKATPWRATWGPNVAISLLATALTVLALDYGISRLLRSREEAAQLVRRRALLADLEDVHRKVLRFMIATSRQFVPASRHEHALKYARERTECLNGEARPVPPQHQRWFEQYAQRIENPTARFADWWFDVLAMTDPDQLAPGERHAPRDYLSHGATRVIRTIERTLAAHVDIERDFPGLRSKLIDLAEVLDDIADPLVDSGLWRPYNDSELGGISFGGRFRRQPAWMRQRALTDFIDALAELPPVQFPHVRRGDGGIGDLVSELGLPALPPTSRRARQPPTQNGDQSGARLEPQPPPTSSG
jgi:hypothetical protein